MTAETKVVNYTPEQTGKVVADYQAGIPLKLSLRRLARPLVA